MKKKYIIYAFFLLTIPATVNAQIKIGNYTFKDGGEYTGEMKSRKPNGKGKTVYKNGDAYEGEYVKGLREGYGIYTKKDGERYEGNWYQNVRHGKGIKYFSNNNRYEGLWFADRQHGQGIMYYYNGDVYEGNWVNDKREGNGKYTWANGAFYSGEWKNDKKNGNGTLDWNDGSRYIGEWKNDMRNGKGKYSYANGDEYIGEWNNNEQHGKGTYLYENKDKYEGDYFHGKRTGKGIYTHANGDMYVGEFVDGEQTGRGKFTWTNGSIYDGQWKHNKREGRGTYTWVNGDVYEGEWKDNLADGFGELTNSDGTVYKGQFSKGKKDGQGVLIGKDGSRFEGFFKQDVKDGPFIEKDSEGNVIVKANHMITPRRAERVTKKGVDENGNPLERVKIRTILTCKCKNGVCAKCYGANMATGEAVQVGEAVGIVAAQSIGEPGTQLTMRTFHTGGVAGDDITQGLPRVEELFEARKPKGLAIITEFAGKATISDTKKKREVIVTNDQTGESKAYLIPYGSRIKVQDGAMLEAGDELTEGSVNPHDILKIKGLRAVQDYMLQEVQRVYRLQGVDINDKHIEVIVRQMLKKVRIEEKGDTEFLPGTMVDVLVFNEVNEQMEAEGKAPATGEQIMLGITKASLATDSFLSAASFQETTKVLTEAAIKGKVDHLVGLKENVIIGKHIPAGTGMKKYRDVALNTDAHMEETIELSMEDEDEASELPEVSDTAEEVQDAGIQAEEESVGDEVSADDAVMAEEL